MIHGVVEFIDQFEVRGWAFDDEPPVRQLVVEAFLETRPLGTATASFLRPDLLAAGMGSGECAFVLNFRDPLEPVALPRVRVEASARDGGRTTLPRWQAPLAVPDAPARFPGVTSDASQFPVFVLGSVRSGTTVMVEGLLAMARFRGYLEGHILDLLRHLEQQAHHFYGLKHLDAQPDRNTMIRRVPIEFLNDGFDHIFIEMARQVFGEGHWVDKTPNASAILLAPRFRRIWPNAKFIFMRRRALENLASRGRKFPHYEFARNCEEWRDAMQAWLSVRDQLHGAAIEVDQMYLARHPDLVANAIRGFLGLDESEARGLEQVFTHGRPQRTAAMLDEVLALDAMGWPAASIAEFDRLCRPTMEQFGYTTDPSYHRDGNDGGLVLV